MKDRRPTINIRVSEAEKAEIEAMCEHAGIPPATLAKKCLLSALAYYREKGHIPMPPVIMPTSSHDYQEWRRLKSGKVITEKTA